MSLDADHVQQLAGRLRRLLEQTRQEAQVERVHHLRTNIRRVESLLQAAPATPFKGKAKLLKRLKRVRRKAGRVRDLDVQLAALASFRLASATSAQQRLQARLEQKRNRQAGQLRRRLKRATRCKLEGGLQLAEEHLAEAGRHADAAAHRQAAATVHRRFARMNRPLDTLSDPELHGYRIQCKRLRYRLEALGDEARSRRKIAALKRIQDAVGTWHDWLTLTRNAEKLLAAQQAGALMPALQQATRRHRRQALRTIAAVRAQWSSLE